MPRTTTLSRRHFVRLAAASAAATLVKPSSAQSRFPSRPIRLLVGFPVGGIVDQVMRCAAIEAEKKLGQPIIIENRPGAGGVVSWMALKSVPPDGYTIAATVAGLWRAPALENVAYDPARDFTYIMNMADNVFAVVVPKDSPFKTWAELRSYGGQHQTEISYGTPPGFGGSSHLFLQEIALKEKLAWQAISYKGSSESITALMGNQITFAVDTVISANEFVRSGKLRFLAIIAPNRLAAFPDVPTMAELGYSTAIDSPIGIGGPAGMPPDVVKALHDAFKFAMEQPAMTSLLDRSSQRTRYMNSSDYSAFIAKATVEQRDLINRLGLGRKK
jgi:tripartite-type tricarboxylate transporter receptor subunit TctC